MQGWPRSGQPVKRWHDIKQSGDFDWGYMKQLTSTFDFKAMSDDGLLGLRAELHAELKKRGIARSVGQMAEHHAIRYYNSTPGRPNLLAAPVGTANVDALSRRGERYSIKGVVDAKKTGTIYPDNIDPDKQLFEYIIVVKMRQDWSLESIYEFTWQQFLDCRSWDKRMSAWYIGLSIRTLATAERFPSL